MFPCWLYPSLFLSSRLPVLEGPLGTGGLKGGSGLHRDSFQALKGLPPPCNLAWAQEA